MYNWFIVFYNFELQEFSYKKIPVSQRCSKACNTEVQQSPPLSGTHSIL
jgi:hypothetical protein